MLTISFLNFIGPRTTTSEAYERVSMAIQRCNVRRCVLSDERAPQRKRASPTCSFSQKVPQGHLLLLFFLLWSWIIATSAVNSSTSIAIREANP